VYQGTDVDRFTRSSERRAVARDRYALPESAGPILGSVGSFEPRKGQTKLLDALVRLRERLPTVHLLLVGDGPDEGMLRAKVADLGLGDCVHFFPFTPEPVYIFEVLDVLVLPSLYKEGLPNVLLEAMSMSVPVVASRLAGVSEVVHEGETGYTVEPGDDAALADAVERLWSDRDSYLGMMERTRALMGEQFDKKQQFRAFLRHFEFLAERFRGRP
jgi:glycosyltransferase involved in cell wall biosynthesis